MRGIGAAAEAVIGMEKRHAALTRRRLIAGRVTDEDGVPEPVALDQLNAALQANNLTATLDTSGKLTISASNDYASSSLGGIAGGFIGGTVTSALTWTAPTAPVADANALATRQSLQNDYVSLLSQIDQLARDASFGGINLIYGDSLKIVFNEKGGPPLRVYIVASLFDPTTVRRDAAGQIANPDERFTERLQKTIRENHPLFIVAAGDSGKQWVRQGSDLGELIGRAVRALAVVNHGEDRRDAQGKD